MSQTRLDIELRWFGDKASLSAVHITLEQAIEIHAKVLRHRRGPQAPHAAREWAEQLASIGDHDGMWCGSRSLKLPKRSLTRSATTDRKIEARYA